MTQSFTNTFSDWCPAEANGLEVVVISSVHEKDKSTAQNVDLCEVYISEKTEMKNDKKISKKKSKNKPCVLIV